MSKRFTDTDKWKREWFCELPPNAKLVWFYLLDQCDHRGVWFRNFRLMSLQLGFDVFEQDFGTWFGDKIIVFDEDKFFIPSFVHFQYGALNPNNKAHYAVTHLINDLESRGLLGPLKDLDRSSQGPQDKATDTDKDKEFNKENWFEKFCIESFNDTGLALKQPKVVQAFKTFDSFSQWLDGVMSSKSMADEKDPRNRKRYFVAALSKELSERGVK